MIEKFNDPIKKYSPFGPTLGMRIGFDEPNLLNKAMLSKHKPTKISLGGSFIICLSSIELYCLEIQ